MQATESHRFCINNEFDKFVDEIASTTAVPVQRNYQSRRRRKIGRFFVSRVHRSGLGCFGNSFGNDTKKHDLAMAPPQKRKPRNSTGKERAIETRYTNRQYRKRPEVSRRVQTNQSIDVPELVYRLLNTDKHNQGARVLPCAELGRSKPADFQPFALGSLWYLRDSKLFSYSFSEIVYSNTEIIFDV